MNLAILTNGGDTCALNASIEAIRKEASRRGCGTIIGIEGGYHGLLYRKYHRLDAAIEKTRGGSVLRSLRESPVKQDEQGRYVLDDEKVRTMVDTLSYLQIDVVVVIGGDGTLQATKMFHQRVQHLYNFKILGFPKTIDNDIRTRTTFEGIEVSLCPGYPTAADKIAEVTRAIRTTAVSAQRVFGIETMGRDAGWLAAASSEGGPDMILIPEYPLDEDTKRRLIDKTEKFFRDFLNVVIVVSEGINWESEDGEVGQITDTKFGPRKLGGVVDRVMLYIGEQLKNQFDKSTPFGVRPHHTDYTPRAGPPCPYDLKLVDVLAERLGMLLESGENGKVPVLKTVVPYDELDVRHTKGLGIEEMEPMLFPSRDFYDADRLLTKPSFGRFLRTITSGPRGGR